ncbi:MAG: hypothetical protein VB980_03495, partial [Opitutales bacterium]
MRVQILETIDGGFGFGTIDRIVSKKSLPLKIAGFDDVDAAAALLQRLEATTHGQRAGNELHEYPPPSGHGFLNGEPYWESFKARVGREPYDPAVAGQA